MRNALRIAMHGALLGALLALPSACLIPLSGIPHLLPPTLRGAEQICFASLLAAYVFMWIARKRLPRGARWAVDYTRRELVLLLSAAIPAGLVMMKVVFVTAFVLLSALGAAIRP